ncbi:MAG: hypothetical protein ACI9BV_001990 [Rhodothermales bacterium]
MWPPRSVWCRSGRIMTGHSLLHHALETKKTKQQR